MRFDVRFVLVRFERRPSFPVGLVGIFFPLVLLYLVGPVGKDENVSFLISDSDLIEQIDFAHLNA